MTSSKFLLLLRKVTRFTLAQPINWDRDSHRTSYYEVTGPEVLAVLLGMPQDGEGGVRGGVDPSQLFQGLAVLLQSLRGGL